MTASSRLTAILLCCAGCLAVATVAGSAWTRSQGAGRSGGSFTRLLESPGEESRTTQARMRAKSQIIERLLANELTLIESAAWFRYLNDNPMGSRPDYRDAYPGNSDGEKACRQVIAWAQTQARIRMTESQAELIASRLEGELTELLSRNERIELPW